MYKELREQLISFVVREGVKSYSGIFHQHVGDGPARDRGNVADTHSEHHEYTHGRWKVVEEADEYTTTTTTTMAVMSRPAVTMMTAAIDAAESGNIWRNNVKL